MDGLRFDTLTKTLAASESRRRVLHSLLAGVFSLLGWQDREDSAAHDLKATCKKKTGEAKKKCLRKARKHAATHPTSPPPLLAPPPPTGCTGSCAGKACGADDGCDTLCQTGSCGGGKVCQNGACVSPCAAGFADCDDDGICETDTNSSEQHCGGCNTPCGTSQTCVNGVCTGDEGGTPECPTPGTTEPCYSGPSGTEGVGVCRAGLRECQSNGTWGHCIGEITPSPETCDNLDNDCNGEVDEDLTEACYSGPGGTAGVGQCKAGTRTCQEGTWGPCVGQVLPTTEICDGLDNDCDGLVDEGFPGLGQPCDVDGNGTNDGVLVCSADGQGVVCSTS